MKLGRSYDSSNQNYNMNTWALFGQCSSWNLSPVTLVNVKKKTKSLLRVNIFFIGEIDI